MLRDRCQGFPNEKWHRHEPRPSSDVTSDRPKKFFIGEDLWAAQLVAGLTFTCVRRQPGDRLCDVLDIDRLHLCLARAEHRIDGSIRTSFTNVVRKLSSGPNMTAGRIRIAFGN